ncbi:unnamed protein product [Nesidiocoris tenuis]|uniref:Uncharacterized protein n=1 Tax=Nesidiocoris tenuis TaxID=355587 RepID=A0A6H5GVI5_9HEMI|nr:unnamed protein product [Nesidiocoris tenuis]
MGSASNCKPNKLQQIDCCKAPLTRSCRQLAKWRCRQAPQRKVQAICSMSQQAGCKAAIESERQKARCCKQAVASWCSKTATVSSKCYWPGASSCINCPKQGAAGKLQQGAAGKLQQGAAGNNLQPTYNNLLQASCNKALQASCNKALQTSCNKALQASCNDLLLATCTDFLQASGIELLQECIKAAATVLLIQGQQAKAVTRLLHQGLLAASASC